MNRRTLRATGIVLTGMLLAGDPVSMIYAAPVAGVSVATTAEAVAAGTGSSSPSAGVSLAVADCLYDTADLSVYEKNANILYDALTGMGFEIVRPGGTFYMFPKAPEPDAVAFCKRAMKQDLLLVPGDTFGCPGYFRMAYCIETEKVERSLDAFRKL